MSFNPSMSPQQHPYPSAAYPPHAQQNPQHQAQYAQRTVSPYPPANAPSYPQRITSPADGRPAKRQRLSPEAQSGIALAPQSQQGMYGNGYSQFPQNSRSQPVPARAPQAGTTAPNYELQARLAQQPHSQMAAGYRPAERPDRQLKTRPNNGNMAPPARPGREDTISELTDSMYGCGVNLKEEENYIHSMFNKQPQPINPQTASHALLAPGSSFAAATGPGGPWAGTFGAPMSQEQIVATIKDKEHAASRARNERLQHHLNNPFTSTNALRNRLMKISQAEGVEVNMTGLYQRSDAPAHLTTMLKSGSTGIVAATESRPLLTVARGEQFEQLLSLLSIATEERLRARVDDCHGMVRARVTGDRGCVPSFLFSAVVGAAQGIPERTVQESITGTAWDKGRADEEGTPRTTVSFKSPVADTLRRLAEQEQKLETGINKRRKARKRKAEEEASEAEGAMAESQVHELLETAGRMSKKELERREKEAQRSTAHSINRTVARAIGKKLKYSWMSADSYSNQYSRPNSSTPQAISSEVQSPVDAAHTASLAEPIAARSSAPKWGHWVERGPESHKIQVRDWINVLDRDGTEQRALSTAFAKQRIALDEHK
ncbi:hypothetical protein K470DRAFT_258121 [Piedraia hortae CBS 480.64]|uniref:Transcription initiation factor TFIID subunit 4 n=1 Tax=Piedraia hortae CBS 480.64 TaxID=1314780 RepID=A0A6A7BYL2_9PEZI|nr:hypothetical protein K470DRAFT_258121 [Piedraia hortae CBS 480.64]